VSVTTKAVLVLFVLVVWFVAAAHIFSISEEKRAREELNARAEAARVAEQVRRDALTPAQRAEEVAKREAERKVAAEQIAKAEAHRNRMAEVKLRAMLGIVAIKKALRDPDSFKLESAMAMDSGAGCYVYRARNGFGGYNREQAVLDSTTDQFLANHQPGFAALWERECAGKVGYDISADARKAQTAR
jgi:hypothetical protein